MVSHKILTNFKLYDISVKSHSSTMPFILKQSIQENINSVTKLLQEETNRIKTKIDESLNNFEQFVITGDPSYLKKEFNKCNGVKANYESVSLKETVQQKELLHKRAELYDPVTIGNVKIKTEKVSDVFSNKEVTSSVEIYEEKNTNENSLANLNTEMPAPKQLPLRKRKIKEEPIDLPKRSTRTRKKPKMYTDSEYVGKISDVVIQNTTIATVDITEDSDKENVNAKTFIQSTTSKENTQVESTRSKRTRTVKKQNVESCQLSSEVEDKKEEPVRTKRTRTVKKAKGESLENQNNPQDDKQINDTSACKMVSEDVASNNADITYIAKKDNNLQNCTVVIDKSKNVKDDVVADVSTPQKQKTKKEIFSPFDKVSTKKKVEAFEKFNSISKKDILSSSSVKTRGNKQLKEDEINPKTPVVSKLPIKVQSTTKVNKFVHKESSSSSNNSLLSTKSQSALKASQAEFQERLKKKQEKEQEALKKREELLIALTEEKKKKREEKQLRAQQQREILEKEKLRLLEMYKLREQKQLNQKAEAERRMLAKKKDEEIINRERNKVLMAADLPIYLTSKAPLLPTDDCYDSDDETETAKPKSAPNWSREYELKKKQLIMLKIGEKIKNTFFSRQLHTPDLQEIFEQIDPRKLKRTSSAIWRKPPRYTVFVESSSIQFSEDDD